MSVSAGPSSRRRPGEPDVLAEALVAGTSGEAALAARIHDRVMPRLSGVALALAGGDLPAEAQRRCHDEITAAMLELRALLRRPVTPSRRSLAAQLQRWRESGAPLRVTRVDGARVPAELDGMVCDVLGEAVRNALRHARAQVLALRLEIAAGCLVASLVNDGISRPGGDAGSGLGLPLAAAVAAEHDGRLEWGPLEGSRWLVKLTVPVPGS